VLEKPRERIWPSSRLEGGHPTGREKEKEKKGGALFHGKGTLAQTGEKNRSEKGDRARRCQRKRGGLTGRENPEENSPSLS